MNGLDKIFASPEWDSLWTPISEITVGQSIWSGSVQCPIRSIVKTPSGWNITVYNPFYERDCTYSYAARDELLVVAS